MLVSSIHIKAIRVLKTVRGMIYLLGAVLYSDSKTVPDKSIWPTAWIGGTRSAPVCRIWANSGHKSEKREPDKPQMAQFWATASQPEQSLGPDLGQIWFIRFALGWQVPSFHVVCGPGELFLCMPDLGHSNFTMWVYCQKQSPNQRYNLRQNYWINPPHLSLILWPTSEDKGPWHHGGIVPVSSGIFIPQGSRSWPALLSPWLGSALCLCSLSWLQVRLVRVRVRQVIPI